MRDYAVEVPLKSGFNQYIVEYAADIQRRSEFNNFVLDL